MTVEEDQGFYTGGETTSNSVGGLAAVWAKANTRDSIFEALSNKETYATSGTRIRLRFFAGDNLLNLNLNDDEFISKVYETGVPMGGDLILAKTKKPSFIVWAQKDKNGAPLQRIQIVKGFYSEKDRETKEQLIDVICSDGLKPDPLSKFCPSNNSSVSLDTCKFSQDKGASELKTFWVDEEYDPNIETFYYLRVLETKNQKAPHIIEMLFLNHQRRLKDLFLHLIQLIQKNYGIGWMDFDQMAWIVWRSLTILMVQMVKYLKNISLMEVQ